MTDNLETAVTKPEEAGGNPAPAPHTAGGGKRQQKGRRQGSEPGKPFKKSKRFTVKKLILLILLIALAGGAAFGVYRLFIYKEPVNVVTGTTKKGSISTTITGSASTSPINFQKLSIPVTGTVNQVFVSQGDKVAVGDKLYTIDTTDVSSKIADLQSTISDYETQLSTYQQNVSNLTITAPFSGKVTGVKIAEGDTVNAGSAVCTMVDDSKMLLSLYFSYAYESDISTGMDVSVSVPDFMSTLNGTVKNIDKVSYITAEGTKCFKVTISVDNPGSLTAGLKATATINTSGKVISPADSGTFAYNQQKTITCKVSGTVSALSVLDYKEVKSGAVLAVIKNDDYANQVTSIQKRIESSKTSLEDEQEILANCSPTATVAGTVIFVRIKAGDTVSSGDESMAIYNTDTVSITANIDESQNEYITKGMTVQISKSGSTKTYTGTVSATSLYATSSNGVAYFPTTITIASNGELSAGVYVTYTITAAQASDIVMAPVAAIKNTAKGTCLFIKADKKPDNAIDLGTGVVPDGYYAVVVTTGLTSNNYVEIKSGVAEGVTVYEQTITTSSTTGSDTTSKTTNNGNQNGQNSQNGQGGGQMPGGGNGGGNFSGGPPGGN